MQQKGSFIFVFWFTSTGVAVHCASENRWPMTPWALALLMEAAKAVGLPATSQLFPLTQDNSWVDRKAVETASPALFS